MEEGWSGGESSGVANGGGQEEGLWVEERGREGDRVKEERRRKGR